MRAPDLPPIRNHEDPVLFREALSFTAAETGFTARLIEKDYFCTVLLSYLAHNSKELVFKGGTCLSKVHADSYRMSEDLDFVISSPSDASRRERSIRVAGLKEAIRDLPRKIAVFNPVQSLKGANDSRQYLAEIGYISLISGDIETVKLEIGLREPILTPVSMAAARTILGNPISAGFFVPPVKIPSLSLLESFAEKFRAALSRQEPAIRDFYDIDYAVRHLGINVNDPDLADLLIKKMAVPGNGPIDVSRARLDELRRQVHSQLKPVLRGKDFEEFDMDRSFEVVAKMALKIHPTGEYVFF